MAGFIADRVSVVKYFRAGILKFHHGLDLRCHRLTGFLRESFRVSFCLSVPVLHAYLRGKIAERIMRRGLVGDNIYRKIPGFVPAQDFGENFSGISH